MEPKSDPPPPLRALLTEAAEYRRRGDLAAATALETDALRAMRASMTAERPEVAQ
jgi:hypothetical protein